MEATLARLADELGEAPVQVTSRAGSPWVGLTTSHAVYIAYDARTSARIEAEAERLQWATGCGLPVPHVVGRGPSWLVTARAANDEGMPGVYAEAAVAAARAISAPAIPPPHVYGVERVRRCNRAGALRLGRLLMSPVPGHEFVSLRQAAARLPNDRLSHGDFHQGNVLFDRKARSVSVVDWEILRYRPAGYDLCKLWTDLTAEEDREVVLDAALADVPDRAALGLLHRWLAIHNLAHWVKGPRSQWDPERIAAAEERLAESRVNARRWAAGNRSIIWSVP